MSTGELKQLVRDLYDDVLNRHDLDALDRYCAAEYVDHNPPTPGSRATLPETKAAFADWLRIFPDFAVTVEDQIAEGDRVVSRLRARATHRGEFNGVPASGRTVEWDGIDIVRIVGGRVVERWGVFDDLSLMDQIQDDEAG
jgi:predicted ester cyclase